MKIDWKKKLTSRKFWAAVVGFVTPTLFAFGANESEVAQVAGIITACATLIAYIIGEGLVDANSVNVNYIQGETTQDETVQNNLFDYTDEE